MPHEVAKATLLTVGLIPTVLPTSIPDQDTLREPRSAQIAAAKLPIADKPRLPITAETYHKEEEEGRYTD